MIADDDAPEVYEFADKAERDRQIWRWHMQGIPNADIADRVGLTERRIRQVIELMRPLRATTSAESIRADLAEQLDWLRARMAALAAAPGAPVVKTVSQGDNMGSEVVAVKDPDSGEYVRDYTGVISASNTLIKAQARMAALLGADAAVKVEHGGTVRYELVGLDPEDLR